MQQARKSNNIHSKTITMNTVVAIIAAITALFTIYVIYLAITSPTFGSSVIVLVDESSNGEVAINSPVPIPRSFNEDKGITFSYACWVKIDSFNYRYGAQKVIFNKGPVDMSSQCPSLSLDPTTNAFIVKLDTFGGTEVIPISNIPAKKWIHVTIAVSQNSIDIYIDGNLYVHHSLVQMPKQNSENVNTSIGGGFNGSISGLTYYKYLLEPEAIASVMASGPNDVPEKNVLPQYYSPAYWVKRL
jgi:hypothetical protein